MRRNTRMEILETARRLFNERGFNAVSTHDIAEALGISKGNLTYYFKKKEDIIEAILEESTGSPPRTPANLEEMHAFILDMQNTVEENGFYFWHHAQLAQLSVKIQQKQSDMYKENTEKISQAMMILKHDGIFREEAYPGEYSSMIDALLLTCIYWKPFSRLKSGETATAGYQKQAWNLLHPLLTDHGKELLSNII